MEKTLNGLDTTSQYGFVMIAGQPTETLSISKVNKRGYLDLTVQMRLVRNDENSNVRMLDIVFLDIIKDTDDSGKWQLAVTDSRGITYNFRLTPMGEPRDLRSGQNNI